MEETGPGDVFINEGETSNSIDVESKMDERSGRVDLSTVGREEVGGGDVVSVDAEEVDVDIEDIDGEVEVGSKDNVEVGDNVDHNKRRRRRRRRLTMLDSVVNWGFGWFSSSRLKSTKPDVGVRPAKPADGNLILTKEQVHVWCGSL